MRSNIETIKFTGVSTTLFAALTYIVALNIDIGFFRPNWCWISNNFALTVCGGAFTGFVVVMLCELQKYRNSKRSCENYMFFQAVYLYTALSSMRSTIGKLKQDTNFIIPPGCLDDHIHMAISEIAALQATDYILFNKNDRLVKEHQKFCMEQATALGAAIKNYGIYLKLAVNIAQRENIEKQRHSGNVTASNPIVARTLDCINAEIFEFLNEVSNYLTVIEQSTKGKYSWTAAKEKIDQRPELRLDAFEDFIKEENPPQ